MVFSHENKNIKFAAVAVIFCLILQILIFFPQESKADSIVTFIGHGYGHGVGLSMTSVFYMSRDDPNYNSNSGYQRILTYFYSGVNWGLINDNTVIKAQRPDGVIVDITMKDYLYRQAEEPNSWPREGLRTLAVVMRTYAWQKYVTMGYAPKWGQAWNPAINPATRPNVVAAVNDTAGQILTYNGKPIVAAYSSSSGGYTARFEDVWQPNTFSSYPYAERVPAPWDAPGANYNWQKYIYASTIETAYPSVGRYLALQVLSRNGAGEWGGRILRLRIHGTNGIVDVKGWDFANAVGLKSNYFTFNQEYAQTAIFNMISDPTQTANQAWNSGVGNWSWPASKPVSGDFNGDGLDDLAVLYGYGGARSRLWVFFNNGVWGYNAPVTMWDSGPGSWDWSGSQVTAGDFNNDNRDDILILYGYAATRQTKAWVFTSTGGAFNPPQQWWDSGPGNWDNHQGKPVSGDFDGDNRDDLAVVYNYGNALTKAWVLTSTGGALNPPQQWWDSGPNNWDWSGSIVMSGNVNNDTRDDLVIVYGYTANRQTKAWVFTSTGGAFNPPQQWWDSGPNNWDWVGSKPLMGDYNGDNLSDLMIYYYYNGYRTVSWLMTSTSGTFNQPAVKWDSGLNNWNWSRSTFIRGRINADTIDDTIIFYNYGIP